MAEAVSMSVLQHIQELRKRVGISLLAVVAGTILCGIYWEPLFELLLLYPLSFMEVPPGIIYTAPADGFILILKLALITGTIAAMPVILWHLWAFTAPALYREEKRRFLTILLFAVLLFITGVIFCYTMLPWLITFLSTYGGSKMDPLYRAQEYLSFLLKLSLAFGLAFELPVITTVLTSVGVISWRTLLGGARYAVVVIFILSAFLTPPDVISQFVLALPLLILYGVSILLSFLRRN